MERLERTSLGRIKPGREGWVYLIHAEGTDRYKIGRSVNPVARHQTLQKQSPYPLKIVDSFWTMDTVHDEAYIHERCKDNRKYGEWFELKMPYKELFWFARGPWSSDTKTILFDMHFSFLYGMYEHNGLNEDDENYGDKCPFNLLLHIYDYVENKKDFLIIDKAIHFIIPTRLEQEGLKPLFVNPPPCIAAILYSTQFYLSGYKEKEEEFEDEYWYE